MQKVVITAGPTQEAIDPVRFITNYSTGKMGYSIAEVASINSEVVLISGPVSLKKPKNVRLIQVTTAEQMLQAVLAEINTTDVLIMTAAVADYKPAFYSNQKIKKSGNELSIKLERTKDILLEVSKLKKPNQLFIGFAAESENLIQNAIDKLKRKKLDWIIANDISRSDIGFGSDENQVTFISQQSTNELPKMTKIEVAQNICELF